MVGGGPSMGFFMGAKWNIPSSSTYATQFSSEASCWMNTHELMFDWVSHSYTLVVGGTDAGVNGMSASPRGAMTTPDAVVAGYPIAFVPFIRRWDASIPRMIVKSPSGPNSTSIDVTSA